MSFWYKSAKNLPMSSQLQLSSRAPRSFDLLFFLLCRVRSWRAIFQLQPNFRTVHQMTPKWHLWHVQGQKYPFTFHTLQRRKFSSVSVYDEPFLSYDPVLSKVDQMTPKWPLHIQIQCTHVHTIYTHVHTIYTPRPIVQSVSFLRWTVVEEIEI